MWALDRNIDGEELSLAILLISIIPIYSNTVIHTVSDCPDRSILARLTTIFVAAVLTCVPHILRTI